MRSNSTLLAAALLAAASITACDSSGETRGDAGRITIRLVDGPSPALAEVNIDVQRVEILGADGWLTLGTPDRVVNLLALTGGVVDTLVDGVTLPAGEYGQLRLLLGTRNTVKLQDGSIHDLTVPSGTQSGVKLSGNFDVAPGTTRDVFIDFDAHRSVFVHGTGSGKYILRPTVRAFDGLATGSISGTLTADDLEGELVGGALPGAVVTAQTLDGAGLPTVVRTTTTGLDGTYVLDLLPAGGTYFVVSQPVAGGVTYDARASGPIEIAEATPTATYDATFTPAAAWGGIAGSVTPVATEADADLVEARRALDAGGVERTFVVRTAPAVVAAGVESYALELLPAGPYGLLLTRRTVDPATGAETVRTSATSAVTVAGGATATANLVVPVVP